MFPLSVLFKKLIREGTLTVIDADGAAHTFGGGEGPEATIRLTKDFKPWGVTFKPGLKAGEAYMDGTLLPDGDRGIYDFLLLVAKNMEWRPGNAFHNMGGNPWPRFKGWLSTINPVARSRKNVAHHYDLSDELYDLFLDAGRQYSCAYFKKPDETLEQAQENKKTLIAKKLLLKKGMRVLDIGCGWGGLALSLHKKSGAHVTGITLSKEQLSVARKRAAKARVADKVSYRLQDFREVRETFDRVVSVGMFEHVGRRHYQTFFNKVCDCLEDDGVALLHTIGRADGPGATDAWTLKYIFPGGYTPALSELTPHIEKAGLYITDIEIWRLHYAETLKEWRRRTFQHKKKIIRLYDQRFFRMWDFYLSTAEVSFRHLGHVVFQIQLAKRIDSTPMTRDYLK
ncbi:MAG: class I SAM-dependent methyltransferase [Proteobacteria bacterium]|nr:class I SAM-dependent methyltransferase [Pseudomonadota bacterium]